MHLSQVLRIDGKLLFCLYLAGLSSACDIVAFYLALTNTLHLENISSPIAPNEQTIELRHILRARASVRLCMGCVWVQNCRCCIVYKQQRKQACACVTLLPRSTHFVCASFIFIVASSEAALIVRPISRILHVRIGLKTVHCGI